MPVLGLIHRAQKQVKPGPGLQGAVMPVDTFSARKRGAALRGRAYCHGSPAGSPVGWCGHAPVLVEPGYLSLRVDWAIHLQFLQRAGACTRPQGPRGGSGMALCVLLGSSPRGPMGICTSMGSGGVRAGGADPNPAHSAQRQLLLSRCCCAEGRRCRARADCGGDRRVLPGGLCLPGHWLRGPRAGEGLCPSGERPDGGGGTKAT